MALTLITAPATEPVSLEEARRHLKIDDDLTADDSLIEGCITDARELAEHELGRSLISQTWELSLDAFASTILLRMPPVTAVNSVKYVDIAGELQTMDPADYVLDAVSEPARLVPAWGKSWPTTRAQVNAVRIEYVAGWPNAAAVPQSIKQWMLLQIGAMYENRQSETTAASSVVKLPFADRLLDRYRIWG